MSDSSKDLQSKLEKVHELLQRKQRISVFTGAGILFLGWILVIILLESPFYLPPVAKTSLILFALLISGISVRFGFQKLKESESDFISFYRKFSRSSNIPELGYALDLEHAGNANPKLIQAAILSNLKQVDSKVLERSLTEYIRSAEVTHTLKTRMWLTSALSVLLILTAFIVPEAAQRTAQFWTAYQKPNPFLFTLSPGDVTLEQGSPFSVEVEFTGEIPEEVSLMLKTDIEENYRARAMESTNSIHSSIPLDLNNDISYYVDMDGYPSEVYRASVQLRPRFSELTAVSQPPGYTGLDSTQFTYPFSRIQSYQGSEFRITGVLNKGLSELTLIRSADTTQMEVLQDNRFEYKFTVRDTDTLSFSLRDENGLSNQNPFRFIIEPLVDEYPYVELVEPAESFEKIDPAEINILFRATDDFDLTKASLNYELRKAFVETPRTGSIPLSDPSNGVLQAYTWDLSALDLTPKDVLTFWVEVTDNDGYNGNKTSRSAVLTLTIPSMIDYMENIGESEDEVETDLEDISESFREMEEQYDEFKEQLKENPETNYQQQRQLQEVQRQQEEIRKKVEELNRKFDEIKKELNQNDMLSEETMEAYEELQRLMEEIDDPEFLDALRKLQENMTQMSPEQLRQALEETEFNEELYKERLERTLELFKQLKLNSDLEKLAKAYEDLARQEEELQNEQNEPEEELQQRESTKEQIGQLKEQLNDLSENTSEKNQKQISELQELSQQELETIQEEIEKLMEELAEKASRQNAEGQEQEGGNDQESGNQENSEQQDPSQQQQQQQNFRQQFQKLAEETRSAMQQMGQQQMNVNIAGLQYILYSLLNLSVEQEDLVTYASSTEDQSQAYIEYARDQKNVEGIFISLSDSLFQLSKQIPQFSNQINEKKLEVERRLTNSLTQMSERDQSRASVATRQALGGINEISFLIANLLEQLQNSSSSGSGSGSMSMQQMMEQMQQMGQDQQQINQQIQEMINDMQGERLTRDQMDRLNQLSRQQNRIREQLQELQRNGGLESGDRLGSEMERMIGEMEETINDLRGGAVDPTLVERQQNILSRMLEAEEAMEERDEEEKREGTTADPLNRTTPPELTLEELEKQIRNRLNDPNFTKFSTDYQRLIEKYFELLKQIQEREIQ